MLAESALAICERGLDTQLSIRDEVLRRIAEAGCADLPDNEGVTLQDALESVDACIEKIVGLMRARGAGAA